MTHPENPRLDRSQFTVRLAETEDEVLASQRLRYRVFVEEMGARVDAKSAHDGIERDAFDPFFDHLVLIDELADGPDRIVGTYRLLKGDVAREGPGFYSSDEFDVSPIIRCGRSAVELGRSCIDRRYRGKVAMLHLWNGVAEYVLSRDIEIMFGVASFPGTDPTPFVEAMSYLHHFHLAPEDIRVGVHADRAASLDLLPAESIDPDVARSALPPLIMGYLRLGGFVGAGVCVDEDFNTLDVCVILDTERMSEKRKAYFVRGYER